MTRLTRELGLTAGDDLAAIERDIVDGPHLPCGEWLSIAHALAAGNKTDIEHAARLRDALAQEGGSRVDGYLSVFLTDKLEPRKSVITKKIRDSEAALATRFDAECERLTSLLDKRRAAIMRDRTHALLVIAEAVAGNYTREKRLRGALDYDDLIEKTLTLLAQGHIRRVGPLQTRPRHRSRADRRGAGYQPQAVGHCRGTDRRVYGRRRRARRQAHHLRRRRREAIDLFVSGRSAARIRNTAAGAGATLPRRRAALRHRLPSITRSAPAKAFCAR